MDKFTFKVFHEEREEFTGTLNACVKKAKAINKKFGGYVAKIEIWQYCESNGWFWVSNLDDFWC